jgi:long-chain fatty acid transport protein
MRKNPPFLCIFGLLLLTASPLYAGAIINKSNQSVDYLRTFNRAAATDYADVAHYNPAGIMKMDSGGYAKLDLMYFAKDYSNTVPGLGELSQDEPSITPGLFTLYKSDKWAAYFTAVVVAGGGEVDYTKGNVRSVQTLLALGVPGAALPLVPQRVQADSVYMGYTIGGAYAINDMFSVSLGARYVDAYKELQLDADTTAIGGGPITAKIKDNADGWGGIIGLNITPNEKWNIGIRYEPKVKLDFELDIKNDSAGVLPGLGLTQGREEREDLPALLSLGGSYKFTDAFKLDGSFVYYFEKNATWESGLDGAGNSWEIGLAAEYIFNPQWKISGGFKWTDIKIDNSQLDVVPEEPKLDARSLGVGAVWSPFPSWSFTASGSYIMYAEETDPNGFTYDKTVWSLGIGAQWKFF